jgi:hypothetical protein
MALSFRAGFLKVSQFGESSPRQHEPELMDDYEPYYAFRWVVTLPRQNPVIADRQCMSRVSWRRRLARQVGPHTRLRDCCWHHSVDWQQASATAVGIARQIKGERIRGEAEMDDRALELIEAAGLPEGQKDAVFILVPPSCGITLDVLAGDSRLSYIDGRKRSHAMMEAGVRRTVVIRAASLTGHV